MQAGVSIIELNARESAIGFYQQLGYENHGFSHTLYADVHHNKMSKSLAHSKSHLIEKTLALQDLWASNYSVEQSNEYQYLLF